MTDIKQPHHLRWLVPAFASITLVSCGGTGGSPSSSSVSSSSTALSSSVSLSSVTSSSSKSSSSAVSSSASSANDLPLVVAIDSGSNASTTLNGVVYQADKYSSGGTTGSTSDAVTGGALYSTERYGALSYEIPVTASGRYTVKLHFAEIYQTSAGKRSFNVAIEGKAVIGNLDLFAKAGHDTGYTETFEDIPVVDGKVSIELIKITGDPTIAGFAIYSNDGKLDTTVTVTPTTNLSKFSAYTKKYTEKTVINSNHATGHVGDFFFTHWKDGGSTSLTLDPNGAFNVTWQGGGYNYVGGPGWHYGDKDRVIGYRLDKDSGASYIALYGWGYDKNLPTSNTARLVEYYILQRWTSDPSTSASFGKTFTSNGIQYSTYRSTRQQKPSINGTATFYQYWSKPSQQRPLGQDNTIIFADHVKAWADSGWTLPDTNNINASDDPTYQVIAVEMFNPGSSGSGTGRVWDATPK